jgi:hypothetical protein
MAKEWLPNTNQAPGTRAKARQQGKHVTCITSVSEGYLQWIHDAVMGNIGNSGINWKSSIHSRVISSHNGTVLMQVVAQLKEARVQKDTIDTRVETRDRSMSLSSVFQIIKAWSTIILDQITPVISSPP